MIILLSILCFLLIAIVFIYIKNFNTYNNHRIIDDAIFKYHIDCIHKNQMILVEYEDEEDYNETLFRIWDWGYTRILPKEKFEIIKPYIDRKELIK